MEVRVRFFGNYRALIDSPELTLELDDGPASPLDVLRFLTERYGEKLRAALVSDKARGVRLKSGIRIAVGDDFLDFNSDLRIPLTKGSYGSGKPINVFIFPALMGGR